MIGGLGLGPQARGLWSRGGGGGGMLQTRGDLTSVRLGGGGQGPVWIRPRAPFEVRVSGYEFMAQALGCTGLGG